MKILHIANDFAGSKVHCNLTAETDRLGIDQTVYCPVRSKEQIGRNKFDGNRTKIIYSYIIKSWYCFTYHHKRRVLYRDLKSKCNLQDFDLIHAATLFSDGALAYQAYKEYGIPYIVAVRGTDINDFGRKLPHAWLYARQILMHAQRIYFISPAPMLDFRKLPFVRGIYNRIDKKIVIRYNGIDDFWHSNIVKVNHEGSKILYIGNFTPNKNVKRLIEATLKVRKTLGEKVTLTLVGGGSDEKNAVANAIKDNNDFVNFVGPMHDKQKLCDIMREHDLFVMPSISETFGLVYIEALSQNLPVIYSQRQGIDGLFETENEPVGRAVDPLSVEDIAQAIMTIFNNRNHYSNNQVDFGQFQWGTIARKYVEDYHAVISR